MSILSKHKLNKNRDALLANDFGKASVNEVLRAVQDAFSILPTVGNKISGKFSVVRAREINSEKEDITDFLTFGPPPISETSQGRANLVGYPVMYAATDGRTAMREIGAIPGQEYYVSIWEKRLETPIMVSLYTIHGSPSTDLHHWVKDALKFVVNEIGLLPKDTDKFLHAMKLRSALFLMENYDISARLAHGLIFNKSELADAVIYPSVVENNRCCFAISPEFTYSSMKLVRVYRMVFSEGFIFRSMARGRPEKGKLDWKKTGEYEIDEEEHRYLGGG